MNAPQRRTSDTAWRRLRRTVAALAVAALGVGCWGASSLVLASVEVERASAELAAYRQARQAVGAEVAALGPLAAQPSRAAALAFLRARREAADALAEAERHADGEQGRTIAAGLVRAHDEYGGSAVMPPAAAERARQAARLLHGRLEGAVSRARARTLAAAAGERRRARAAVGGIPVAAVLALGLLVAPLGRRRAGTSNELLQLTHAALTDSLTGLGNHRAFHEDMKRVLQHRNTSGARFTLMMVDLDGLKQINDTLGHQVGDERIREAADLLRAVVRETDAAYRTGGDEFMIILPGERAWGALNAAQRLQELMARPGCRVSMTAGVAESIGLETKETLIRQADLALYEAKRTGRKVVAYSPDLGPETGKQGTSSRPDQRVLVATVLARAVDAKDPTTRAHCETVSELCALLAEELGLDAATVARLRLAGLLHDVGKIGIPDAILQKTAPLELSERAVIETHPLVGASIVSAAGFDEEAHWIRHHHERFAGRGYPNGLRGVEIPLESRIILVADAFEAITAGRPYRKALSAEAALGELARNAGTQLDPECVGALRSALDLAGPDALVA